MFLAIRKREGGGHGRKKNKNNTFELYVWKRKI
jgi:hypothetical protein